MSFGTSSGHAPMASRAFTVSVVSVTLFSALKIVYGSNGTPEIGEPYNAMLWLGLAPA